MSGRVVVVCTLPTFTCSSAMAKVVNAVPAIASAVMDVMILVCFIFLIYWCVIDRRNKRERSYKTDGRNRTNRSDRILWMCDPFRI